MPHYGLHFAQVPCLLVDADGPSVAKAVEGLIRRNEPALGLVARPLGLEVGSIEGFFHPTEDVLGWWTSAPSKGKAHYHIVRNWNDSVPSALVSAT